MLLLAAALFAAIFALRISDPRPADAILVLCVVPIVICAIDHGPLGGLLASLVALALTVMWEVAVDADVGPQGYVARTVAFVVVALVVGRYAEQAGARERRLERSFDATADLWCTAGFDGYFKQINPAWSNLLGYTDEELHPGHDIRDVGLLEHVADRAGAHRVGEVIQRAETVRMTTRVASAARARRRVPSSPRRGSAC